MQATWSRQFVRMPNRKANKTHCGKRTDTGLNRDQGVTAGDMCQAVVWLDSYEFWSKQLK